MAETTLELALVPDAATDLFRHAAIATRARRRAARLSFLGSTDGTLQAQGLVAIARGGQRVGTLRLVRAMPQDATPWLPGAPMPVLAETPLPAGELSFDAFAALGLVPHALVPLPLASLEGREATAVTEQGVTVVLIAGALRAMLAESAVARVTLAGERAAVFALAAALAADLPLSVPATSLAEEACALARGEKPLPLRDGAPEIPRDATTAEAFAASVAHLALALLANAPAAFAGETPAGTHQSRVALRRLRSVLSLFKEIAGPEAASVSAELKALAGALGPARDWDVFLEGRLAEAVAAFPGDERLALLRADAEAARERAYARLRAALGAPSFRLLGLSLAALARAPRDSPEPAREFAERALNRRLRRVLRHGEDLAGLPPPALHALRLDAKRLRYAAETFAPLFGERKVRRFLRALAGLQDALGHLNDMAVAAGLLAELASDNPNRAFAIGVVEGWIAAKADGARGEALAAWERFLGREVFWRG